MPQPVYLIDTACFKPPEHLKVDSDGVIEIWRQYGMWSDEDLAFQKRIQGRSGLSLNGTYLPPSLNPAICLNKPRTDLKAAMDECQMTVNGAVTSLLEKTGIDPKSIDILITTCSIFCPTPSMASMVVNTFKMRSDVQSYHLGGMGCSNGVVGINLCRDMLQAHPNANVLFVTTEVTTPAFYRGSDRYRQVTNLLFRMGATAALLSNNRSWGNRIKYQLKHNQRVHIGQSDDAYGAIHYSPDAAGIDGIYLGKNVVTEASRGLTKAITAIGPKVLKLEQQVRYGANVAARKLGLTEERYHPRFSGSVEHFLIHAGGAKVLDGLGKALQLTDSDLEPSRMVLHDYGNVSSSTTWYTLGYVESVRGVHKGDTIMQIGVGSGIKCGVNVWKATRDIRDVHEAWEHRVPQLACGKASASSRLFHFVDMSSLPWVHVMFRLLFLAIMCLAVGTFHLAMFAQQQQPGVGLVFEAVAGTKAEAAAAAAATATIASAGSMSSHVVTAAAASYSATAAAAAAVCPDVGFCG